MQIQDVIIPKGKSGVSRSPWKPREDYLGVQGALDWFPRSVWSLVLHWPDLIYLSTAALSFYAGANLWEELGHTVWKAPVWVARQGTVPRYQIKDLANDHRTAKGALDVCTPLEKTNTSTFRGCTDAENKIWGVHVDLSSAPRTSFNMGIKGLQIPNFDPIACQSPASPWLNSVTSCGATAQQLFRWFSCRSVIACFFFLFTRSWKPQ